MGRVEHDDEDKARNEQPHSHVWIDPAEPPIERAPYAQWYGEKRHELKPDRTYRCRVCKATIAPVDQQRGRG